MTGLSSTIKTSGLSIILYFERLHTEGYCSFMCFYHFSSVLINNLFVKNTTPIFNLHHINSHTQSQRFHRQYQLRFVIRLHNTTNTSANGFGGAMAIVRLMNTKPCGVWWLIGFVNEVLTTSFMPIRPIILSRKNTIFSSHSTLFLYPQFPRTKYLHLQTQY